jgi:Fur family ferric uptake transcriptional regulator
VAVVADVVGEMLALLGRQEARITRTRRSIVEVVARFQAPFTVTELTDAVSREDPGIGRASIFRTLALLVQAGAVQRLHGGPGRERYTVCVTPSHHHHVTCTRCGRTAEFSPRGVEHLERAVERAVTALGFRVGTHILEVQGICQACHSAIVASPTGGERP